MKKKIAGILAAIMVLSMTTPVFASLSPEKQKYLEDEAIKYFEKVSVSTDVEGVQLSAAAVEATDMEAIYDTVSEKAGVGCTVLAAVALSSATTLPDGGVQLTFTVEGLTAGADYIRIYHKKDTGWEVKTPFVGNGYVTATFDSLSPFFVVQYDSAPASSDGAVDSSTIVNYNYYYTTENTNSNNTTTYTNSNNTSNTNSTYTNSNNTTTTNNNAAKSGSSKSTSDSSSTDSSSTKKSTKKTTKSGDTTDKDSSSKTPANANDNSSSSDNSSKNDNSSNNNQTVTVNVSDNGSGSGKGGTSTATTSPKTGASLPALPMIALFAAMGIAVCGKKARSLR